MLTLRRKAIAAAPTPERHQSPFRSAEAGRLDAAKFRDPVTTASGAIRAWVTLQQLETLWINTGTLCNLSCANCYIESSPTNDALVYITLAEVEPFLEEARALGACTIGFTGGEPFMNPAIIPMLQAALTRGFEVLVLTNAMRPMRRFEEALKPLASERLTMRVSLDHHSREVHEAERGRGSWDIALSGLQWLSEQGFCLAVAGRRLPGESEDEARAGYARLLSSLDVTLAAGLVLFPEMDVTADVPEISEECWSILGVSPGAMMCATSRMIVKAKGKAQPHVVACTLLPHDAQFALGATLSDGPKKVALNHPHCARFCVLGGASCSG